MKRHHGALIVTVALALTAVGCAGESSPGDDVEQEAEAQSEQAEQTFKDSRGYQFVSKRVEDVLDEIDATDAQRAKAVGLKDRMAEDIFSMKDDGIEVRAEALEEWKKSEPDADAMHALVDERIEVYRKLLHDAVDGAIEMHGALTPEQRAEIAELVEERMKRHRH